MTKRKRIAHLVNITAAFALIGLAGVSVTAGEKIPPQPVDGKIQWVYDYDEGQRLAKETGKPLFVIFRCER